ncbi:MAG: hypothetical protein WC865_08240 [Bacteroidales bacterium]
MKPVRFAADRHRKDLGMNDYPFYRIDSEELHEVGVGPIHAGVIEPGHFRFICNGEKVIHLEIQLGYQHRGIEKLMLEAKSGLTRSSLQRTLQEIRLWDTLLRMHSSLNCLPGSPSVTLCRLSGP